MVLTAAALGAIGAIGSGLLSAGGSIGSTFMSNATSKGAQARAYNYARALQQQQYDLNQLSLRESPGNTRKGLTSAGYNPMLAFSSATNAPTVAGGTPVSANAVDVSGLSDSMNKLSNFYKTIEEAKNINKNTELMPYDRPLKVLGDVLSGLGEGATGKSLSPGQFAKSISSNVTGYINDLRNSYSNYIIPGFKSLLSKVKNMKPSEQVTMLKGYVSNLDDSDLNLLNQKLSPEEMYIINRAKFEAKFKPNDVLPKELINNFPQ